MDSARYHPAPRILLIDDEPAVRAGFSLYLSKVGFEVSGVASISEARERLSAVRFDIILLDLTLPDGNGLDYIVELRSAMENAAVIVITGAGDVPTAVEAMRRGADHFLTKPVNMGELEVLLRKGMEVGTLRRQNTARRRLSARPSAYFGNSGEMKRLKEMADLAADSAAPVVLWGETGSGKGVLARWIHEQGPRKAMAFVEINCSSLRGEMLASELFGHVKGAFTSAHTNRQGLLELADGGTLFLDEVGDMDASIQASFLKVLEEKRYRRLGESTERRSDFRLITATNCDLEEAVRVGSFRKDLYFRINVLPVRVPPLRDHLGDLRGLAAVLLKDMGRSVEEVSPDVWRALKSYAWPGNIRELKNLLERASLLSRGGAITLEHFQGLSVSLGESPATPAERRAIRPDRDWNEIQRVLASCGGDVGEAAERLGVSRATLYRRIKKLRPPNS